MHGPVPEWAAVGFFDAGDGAWDADELGAHLFCGQADLGVAVSAEIDELEVRSQIGVGQRACALQIETLGIFKARADTMPQQHVIRPVRPTAIRPVREEQRAQRMIFA